MSFILHLQITLIHMDQPISFPQYMVFGQIKLRVLISCQSKWFDFLKFYSILGFLM
jgi:hypothetical protein